jgi:hypothetical protein
MKHRAVAFAGIVLGIVALASSFAEPMAFAQGRTGPSATITVTCRSTGVLFVDDTYSGFPGGVRGVDFLVGKVGETVDPVKGGSGEMIQAFNQSTLGSPVDWGAVSVQLLGQNGRVIAGSTVVWDTGSPVTC